jgi:TM2 domain-containing membrane protein YozV
MLCINIFPNTGFVIVSKNIPKSRKESDNKNSVSVHRAFIYGASAPGFGEIYAGSRIRGLITAGVFIFFLVWFNWLVIEIMVQFVDLLFHRLNHNRGSVLYDLPFFSLGISFLGMYYVWLWAMISSVDVAVKRRQQNGSSPQLSVPWGVAMSWFCPGAGQIYTGYRQIGYILFAGNLLGIILIIPAYTQLFTHISLLVKSQQFSASNPYVLINIIREHLIILDYSFGNLAQKIIRYFAIAFTVAELMQGILHSKNSWTKPSAAYGIGLFVLGWLCPGSGQLLQKRPKTGWYFFTAYVSSIVLIGLLLKIGFISAIKANTFNWISVFIQWGAMIEALYYMIRSKGGNNVIG